MVPVLTDVVFCRGSAVIGTSVALPVHNRLRENCADHWKSGSAVVYYRVRTIFGRHHYPLQGPYGALKVLKNLEFD